jgi:tRNA modification GTPase
VVEREGVNRAEKARQSADLVLLVLDGSEALREEDRLLLEQTRGQPRLVLVNKVDLPAAWGWIEGGLNPMDGHFAVSARTGEGLEAAARSIARAVGAAEESEIPALSNARHVALLERARSGLNALLADEGLGQKPEEVVLAELAEVRASLEEVTGERTSEDVLEEIFSRFCVGK